MNLFKKIARIDWLLVGVLGLLCTISVMVINSATYTAESAELREAYLSQLYYVPLGLIVFFVLALIDYEIWVNLSLVIFGFVFILLVAVLFTRKVNGASSWLRFGGIGIQPAELCKVAFILLLAFFLQYREKQMKSFSTFLMVLGILAVPVLIILKQPDLGSAAVLFPIAFTMMFVAGVRLRYLLVPVFLGLAVIFYTYWGVHLHNWPIPGLKPYQMNRIKTFYDPSLDPLNAGWTINQSLISIGSGGWGGKGWRHGTQNVLGFLPKNIAYNDFIFSVIGEEGGFVGGSILIILEGFVLLTCVRVASEARDTAGTLIASGICALLFTHIFQNIGMTIQVVPITGIPLPFISYGGTFLVVCFAAMGIVQSIWVHRRKNF